MAKIPVYRFRYFSQAQQAWTEAPDYATEKAIRSIGGELIADSEKLVEEGLVSFSGILGATQD
jgi:hypothetical protein